MASRNCSAVNGFSSSLLDHHVASGGVAADRHGGDRQQKGRGNPQHQDMLADGHVDAGDGRQMNQRMIGWGIGDVAEDGRSSIEALGGSMAGFGGSVGALSG